MPIYVYKCPACGYRDELFLRQIDDEAKEGRLVVLCPECNNQMVRLISIVNHKKVIEG